MACLRGKSFVVVKGIWHEAGREFSINWVDFLYNPVITDDAPAELLVGHAEHSRQPFENLTGLSGKTFASAFLLAKELIQKTQTVEYTTPPKSGVWTSFAIYVIKTKWLRFCHAQFSQGFVIPFSMSSRIFAVVIPPCVRIVLSSAGSRSYSQRGKRLKVIRWN